MTLEQKKEHILRCIKLGMELYRAELVAECTDEEIMLIEKDEIFMKKIQQRYALQEYELLLKHNTALDLAKSRGNATPIQWRLSKLNPSKWDSKDKELKIKPPEAIQVNLTGRKVEDTGH
jgi:hypothetical protein